MSDPRLECAVAASRAAFLSFPQSLRLLCDVSSTDRTLLLVSSGISGSVDGMATLFTKIINGEIPGRFVYQDDLCVAFLTIAPIRPGHTLVVPRQEIDHWVDAPPHLTAHLFQTAQIIAKGIQKAFPCAKVGLMVAGLEVPHLHIHLTPIDDIGDMSFSRQDQQAKAADLDAAAEKIRAALKD